MARIKQTAKLVKGAEDGSSREADEAMSFVFGRSLVRESDLDAWVAQSSWFLGDNTRAPKEETEPNEASHRRARLLCFGIFSMRDRASQCACSFWRLCGDFFRLQVPSADRPPRASRSSPFLCGHVISPRVSSRLTWMLSFARTECTHTQPLYKMRRRRCMWRCIANLAYTRSCTAMGLCFLSKLRTTSSGLRSGPISAGSTTSSRLGMSLTRLFAAICL